METTTRPGKAAARTHASSTAGRRAAARAGQKNSVRLDLPCLGHITLPPTDQLAFLGGVAALAVFGVVDWPVAGLLGLGHLLATNRSNRVLHDFGEALEEA